MKFEFIEHTADVAFNVKGKNLEEIFENSALAFSSFVGREKKITARKKKLISLSAKDHKALLYLFIDELIYLVDAESFITSRASVSIKDNVLKATIYGDDTKKYPGAEHVKAATYADMVVKNTGKVWEAHIVLDV